MKQPKLDPSKSLPPTLAWHFLRADRRLQWGPTDRKPLRAGSVLVHEGGLCPCNAGLHASLDILDALSYAPGPIICRVTVSGRFVPHGSPIDKLCCSRRKLLRWVDGTAPLRLFAADCAARSLRREETAGRKVDQRSWNAVRAARAFAQGEITADQLAAARAAAEAAEAAGAAAGAARAAAWAAAGAARAAVAAAVAAAEAARAAEAAWAAAGAARAAEAAWAAWAAAGAAERRWQRRRLLHYLPTLREVRL